MLVSKVKNYYVEDTLNTTRDKRFSSLKKAVEFCVKEKKTHYLIHIGSYNLAYYRNNDTYETLYAECVRLLKKFLSN